MADSSFDRDPRRRQELAGRPLADAIYTRVLKAKSIQRFDHVEEETHLLDRVYGIDVEVTLPTGQVLTGQEKFLSASYARYNSLTIEYMQNPTTGECGDWFKLCPDFYAVAYFAEDNTSFAKWAIVDTSLLKLATAYGHIEWQENANKDGRARASFRYIDLSALPATCRRCVLFQSGFWTNSRSKPSNYT